MSTRPLLDQLDQSLRLAANSLSLAQSIRTSLAAVAPTVPQTVLTCSPWRC